MNFLANPILGAFLWVRILWTSLVAQTVKNLSAMQETQVRSLGWEDPLEEEIATHSSILAQEIPWTIAHQAPLSMGLQRVGHDRSNSVHTHNIMH